MFNFNLEEKDKVIIKELKIKNPTYCKFNLYHFNGLNWSLREKTIITNKNNKLSYNISILKNILFVDNNYTSINDPGDEILKIKELIKK